MQAPEQQTQVAEMPAKKAAADPFSDAAGEDTLPRVGELLGRAQDGTRQRFLIHARGLAWWQARRNPPAR
jgi:hypothetical protein